MMNAKRVELNYIFSILVLFISLFSQYTNAKAPLCRQVLLSQFEHNLISIEVKEKKRLIFTKKRQFNIDDFYSKKSQFLDLLSKSEKMDSSLLKTAEEKLAFFEAFAESKGYNYLSIRNYDKVKLKKLITIFQKVSLNNFKTHYQMEEFLREIYKLSNNWTPFFERLLGPSADQIIEERLEVALLKEDMIEVLSDLNIIKDFTFVDRLKSIMGSYGSAVFSVFASTYTYNWFGFPLVLNTKFVDSIMINENYNYRKLNFFANLDSLNQKIKRITRIMLISVVLKNSMALLNQHAVTELEESLVMPKQVAEMISYNIFSKGHEDSLLKESMNTQVYQIWKLKFRNDYGYDPSPETNLVDRKRWEIYVAQMTIE